jgi:hypothetical protein
LERISWLQKCPTNFSLSFFSALHTFKLKTTTN